MSEQFTIVPGITAEVWGSSENGDATGLILNPGKKLTDDELEAVVGVSDTNARVWEAISDNRGLFAHGRSVEKHSPLGDFLWFNHLPNIPNVMPHSDDQDFILFSDVPRPGQDTVVSQRVKAMEILLDAMERFLETRGGYYFLTLFRIKRARLIKYALDGYSAPMHDGTDLVITILYEITADLARAGILNDAALFELEQVIHAALKDVSFRCVWDGPQVLFVTKQAFHYRLCETADLINRDSMGMWHRIC